MSLANYTKISEKDIVDIYIRSIHENWRTDGVITPSNITYLLKTSRYQVDKHIKKLKNDGVLEYKSVIVAMEEDFYPPLNGYRLTKKGEAVYAAEISEVVRKHTELIKKLNQNVETFEA